MDTEFVIALMVLLVRVVLGQSFRMVRLNIKDFTIEVSNDLGVSVADIVT